MQGATILMVVGLIVIVGTVSTSLLCLSRHDSWEKFWKGMFAGGILLMIGWLILNEGTAMKGRRVVIAQEYPGYVLVDVSAGNFTLIKGSHAVVCYLVKKPWPYIVVLGRK